MIVYKITCARCGTTWEEGIDEHLRNKPDYQISKHEKRKGYEDVTLCPACQRSFEKWLAGDAEAKNDADISKEVNGYYVATHPTSPMVPVLILLSDVNAYTANGYKVVTLKSYLYSKDKEKEEN